MSATTATPVTTARTVVPRQYSPGAILGIWAAAALPMGAAAWLIAPALSGGHAAGTPQFAKNVIACFTAGLVWQFVLVVALVAYEQRSLRWAVVREALWLNPPTDRKGRRGGRLWLVALAAVLGTGVAEFAPIDPHPPASRDFGALLSSDVGHTMLRGNWGLLALIVTMALFNTVFGEELLFRGLLLPRMHGTFGRADWVVNGILFGVYHLHQPWSIPSAVTGGMVAAYASKRTRSAWMGILAHSAQTVLLVTLTVIVVLS
ncbi:MAG TPA: type II CAAX endopeptidase family protein [Micromonosporaceae bacterium]|nr:type II CAAX endopeptidase family protein [Micromonosporaceae bacterium]